MFYVTVLLFINTFEMYSFEMYNLSQFSYVFLFFSMLTLGLGIVWFFFDTGAKSILLKQYRCLNGAWTDTYKTFFLPINNWIGH